MASKAAVQFSLCTGKQNACAKQSKSTAFRVSAKKNVAVQRAASLSSGNFFSGANALAQSSGAPRAERMQNFVVKAAEGRRGRRGQEEEKEFEERVVQVRRVTKVVKGGKQLSFRAVVIIGDYKGRVGVGCAKAKEVITAVQKAVTDAQKELVTVKLATKASTLTHRVQSTSGGATVMLRPAAEGTGVIAGGSVRVVLELAGVKNAFGKQLGSPNALNNARATAYGLQSMRQFQDVAKDRDLTVEELFS
ncbi:hypothetical protein CYMTET_24740 [Cymbomonas tetramitiformis]|uniref:Small ribosomal subunit protein uS5c n=1 Tax=Cymbomonas tetramitiformis TaxID=36881 RepID=A0AAE0FVI1_9CHLO|nr:hypothetical protein CYMTET_24740 [Cymbomonas tetramitiformis]|eukprot:gene7104-8475_t